MKDAESVPSAKLNRVLSLPLVRTMPFYFADSRADSHHFIESPWIRAPKEIACALAASLLVSPLVSIIDKCLVQEIAGIKPMMISIKAGGVEMMKNPRQFVGTLSFRLTVIVYFGTYAVANLSELGLDEYRVAQEEKRKQIKASCAATANIGLLAWRDMIFAREFSGNKGPARKAPKTMIGMFALRDFGTMGATFYGAPKAAEYLVKENEVNKEVAELSMALLIPVISQYVTAPLHIHAMDIYARPVATAAERVRKVVEEYNKISFARAMRILPAFGIGSYSNNKLRETFIRQPDFSMYWTRRVIRLVSRTTRAAKAVTG
jgi:hypothetical protein